MDDADRVAGQLSNEAVMYCAAHFLVIEDSDKRLDTDGRPTPDGGSGVVVSETIGPRSVSYATPEGRKFYERSYYGRMFLELRSASPSRHLPRIYG